MATARRYAFALATMSWAGLSHSQAPTPFPTKPVRILALPDAQAQLRLIGDIGLRLK